MKILVGLIQKVAGILIILVVVVAFFGGCDDTASQITGGSMGDNRSKIVITDGGDSSNGNEAEPAEAETTAVADNVVETGDRNAGVAEQALVAHKISLDTIEKIVTKYRYGDDTEYTSTFDDYEFLYYLEDSIEEYHYKITEEGYGSIGWETEEDRDIMKQVLCDSELSVMTRAEVDALSEEDLIGIYGMCYDYSLSIMGDSEGGADRFADGVSSSYGNVSGMVDTGSVIADYHDKGYTYVWLESHEVKAPDDGKAGDYGTIDEVTLKATYVDEDGLYHFTKEIIALYVYWGDQLLWHNNYELGTIVECDASGFNDTYWKVIDRGDDAEEQYNEVTSLLDNAESKSVPSQDEARTSECYLAFYNFDQLQPSNDIYNPEYVELKNGSRVDNATAVFVINGEAYSKPLKIKYEMGSSYPSLIYNGSHKPSANLIFAVGEYRFQHVYYVKGSTTKEDLVGSFGTAGSELFITPVTKEEYLSVKEKAFAFTDSKSAKADDFQMEEEKNEGQEYLGDETNETDDSAADTSQYILPDSDSRYYTEGELSGYTKEELRLARNEIYARHGRIFDSRDLNDYFQSQSWYNGYLTKDEFDESVLNSYEKENLLVIKAVEDTK